MTLRERIEKILALCDDGFLDPDDALDAIGMHARAARAILEVAPRGFGKYEGIIVDDKKDTP